MTKLKIKRLQQNLLEEIAATLNDSMSLEHKVGIVRATLNRYDRQIKNLHMDEAIKDLAKKDREIVEAKYDG